MRDALNAIESVIRDSEVEFVAVALYDFQTGREIFIRADEPLHSASTFKVGVMMEIFHQAAQGRFALEDNLPVINSFASLADGSSFSTFVEDDAEKSLYERIGGSVSIRALTRLMIVHSSNLATNLLIQKAGAARVQEFLRELGIQGVQILRGVEDRKAYALGLNNTATARGLMQMMKVLAEEIAVSPRAREEMIQILLEENFHEGIPARLRAFAKVAHKTGWIEKHYHDFGIVFIEGRKPYCLAVMTRGFEGDSSAHKCVANISWHIHQALNLST